MKKNEVTTSWRVMFFITFICVVTFITSLSYYQHQDLVNRKTIHDLTNNLTELREINDKTYTMKMWYTDAYNSCKSQLIDDSHKCPSLRIMHPSGEDLTMNESFRFEYWIPMSGVNSTLIHYNPYKVQVVRGDYKYALFTTNLSHCDFP